MCQLFSPIRLRGITLGNRIVVPPMHQYAWQELGVSDPLTLVPPAQACWLKGWAGQA